MYLLMYNDESLPLSHIAFFFHISIHCTVSPIHEYCLSYRLSVLYISIMTLIIPQCFEFCALFVHYLTRAKHEPESHSTK